MKHEAGPEIPTGSDGETVQVTFDRGFPYETKVKIDHVGGETIQQWIFLTPEAAESLGARLIEAARLVRHGESRKEMA